MCDLNDGMQLEHKLPKVSSFRRILPQVIATSVKNLLIIDLGLIVAMPSIIIPALSGISNEHNQDEPLKITANQASWIGGMGFLTLPLGSMISGLVTDPIGRKYSMLLANIPFAIGWIILYRANDVTMIYSGLAILGVSYGVAESAVITYLGEISEPSVRGILISYSMVSGTLGMLVVFILNTLMPWRSVALVCLTLPVVSAIALCFVPETPQWLLSKNRPKDAKRSLCWLRGWIQTEAVSQEFIDLQRHSKRSKSCNACIEQHINCPHPLPTLREKLSNLSQKSTLKAFAIVIPLFALAQFGGALATRPYIVQIFKAYNSPIALSASAAILSFTDNIAQIAFVCLIRFTDKRRLYLTITTIIFLSTLTISFYGFIYLPNGFNSFDQQNQTFHLQNENLAYIPLLCLFAWNFASYLGFLSMPWVYLSEIFSFKVRGVAAGVSAAVNYTFGFISRKTYYNLETSLSMPGVSLLYCVICGVGLIYAYFTLPETEGRTLEDIEVHFADDSKKLTDLKIAKTNAKKIKNGNSNVEFGLNTKSF